MRKFVLILFLLIGCQKDFTNNPIDSIIAPVPAQTGIALAYDNNVSVSTTSSDPIFKRMTQGFPVQNCQWQTLYFIGYGVVRVDKIMSDIDIEMIDWIGINNQLTQEYYKVYTKQILVDPSKAVDPTRSLEKGWQWAIIQVNNYKIGVAYIQVPASPYYQVSFVKFTEYK